MALSTGRDERIRTSDPHTPSVMRYQAALRPDSGGAPIGRWQGQFKRQSTAHACFTSRLIMRGRVASQCDSC